MFFHSTPRDFAIGELILPTGTTGKAAISFCGKDKELAIRLGIYSSDRVYLYEMDTEDLDEHLRVSEPWPKRDGRRIYEVEGVGDREDDTGFNAPDYFCSYPAAIVLRCLYSPE